MLTTGCPPNLRVPTWGTIVGGIDTWLTQPLERDSPITRDPARFRLVATLTCPHGQFLLSATLLTRAHRAGARLASGDRPTRALTEMGIPKLAECHSAGLISHWHLLLHHHLLTLHRNHLRSHSRSGQLVSMRVKAMLASVFYARCLYVAYASLERYRLAV